MGANKAFFIKNIIRSLLNSGGSSIVMFVAILFGSAISTALISLNADIERKISSELNTFGPNAIISPNDLNGGAVDEIKIDEFLKNINGLKASLKYLFGTANIGVTNAVVMGVEFENLKKIMPFLDIKSGEFITISTDRFGLIGINLAKTIGAKVGDTIEIAHQNEIYKVRIKGIIFDGQKEDNLLLISLNLAQEIFDKLGLINYAELIIDGDVRGELNAASSDADSFKAEPIAKVSKAQGQILAKIKLLMLLIGCTILLIASIGVHTTLSSILLARVKEFALRLALGASAKLVFALIFAEIAVNAVLAAILGAVLGYFLGVFLGYMIFSSGIDFSISASASGIFITLVFAALASIYPVKRALNNRIADLLRE